MCRPASMIVAKNKVFWSRFTDSHTALRAEFKLPDRNFDDVKIEIVPPDEDYSRPLKDWLFSVDQPSTPDWWDREDAEKRVRTALPAWVAARTIAGDATIAGGLHFVFSGAPVITQSGGEVRAYDSSAPVITQSGGEVRACDSSAPVITQSGGEVRACDSSAPVIKKSEFQFAKTK